LAETVTTPAVKERLLQEAERHEEMVGEIADGRAG